MAVSRVAPDRLTAVLLACGLLAGPLFVLTFLGAGALRDGYDPLRHPVSALALGPGGWVQVVNFLVAGALCAAAAAGLARVRASRGTRLGWVLVGAAGVGLLGSGAFLTDPVSGYPPGTPDLLTAYSSTEAMLHDLFSIPVFLGLPLAALAYAAAFWRARVRGWALASAAAGLAMAVAFVLASAAFAQIPGLVPFGGLLQRLSIVAGLGWLSAVSLRALAARKVPSRRR